MKRTNTNTGSLSFAHTHTTPSSVRQTHNRIFVFIRCTGKMQEVKWKEEVGYKDGSPAAAPLSLFLSLSTISNGNQIMYMPPGRRQSTQAGRQAIDCSGVCLLSDLGSKYFPLAVQSTFKVELCAGRELD